MRVNGNGGSVANDANDSRSEGEDNDTIHVQTPHPNKTFDVPIAPKLSTVVSIATPSSTCGMEDINLSSPSTAKSLQRVAMKPSKRKRPDFSVPNRTLSSTMCQLSAKPGTSKGSVSNPINLDEYSPRHKPVPLPKSQQHDSEPHKFRKRYQKIYKYTPRDGAPRTALAPKPPNANSITFTGNKGDDMYRMKKAKMAAAGITPPAVYNAASLSAYSAPPPAQHMTSIGQDNHGYGYNYSIPFEVQYPMSTRCLAQPPTPYQSQYAQYHTQMGVSSAGDSEDMLRKRALQYVREFNRSGRVRTMISNDVDETSASDSGAIVLQPTVNTRATHPSSENKRKKLHVYHDPTDAIPPLVAQTSLLTSLLQLYTHSRDQAGLSEDIKLLVSSTTRSINAWLSEETHNLQRAPSPQGPEKSVPSMREEQNSENQMDKEVRRLLSAGAHMWQDGSGEGLVDVYAHVSAHAGEADPPLAASDCVSSGVEIREFEQGRGRGVCGWDMVR